MTLSINCKDAGDPFSTHTMHGETKEELFKNAKEHGIQVHSYTEVACTKEITQNKEHFKNLLKQS